MFNKKYGLLLIIILLVTSLFLLGCGNDSDDNGESLETGLEDAKTFVGDINSHSIDLSNAGQAQVDDLHEHFNEDVIPYGMALGSRLVEIGEVFDAINLIGPGKYTINLAKINDYRDIRWWRPSDEDLEDEFNDYDEYRDEYYDYYWDEYNTYREFYFAEKNADYDDYDDYLEQKREEKKAETGFIVEGEAEDISEGDNLTWDLEFENNDENVIIEATNPEDIIEEEIIREHEDYDDYYHRITTVDLTKGEFEYTHTDSEDDDFKRSLTLALENVQQEETVEYKQIREDEEYNEKSKYDETFILPRVADLKLEGDMNDNRSYVIDDGEKLPEINEIKLNATMQLDAEADKSLRFEGEFSSDMISFAGKTDLEFSKLPKYQEIVDLEKMPIVDNFKSEGVWDIGQVRIDGNTNVNFSKQEVMVEENKKLNISLPETINFAGSFENNSNANPFSLIGEVDLETDYDLVDLDKLWLDFDETDDNYLPLEAELDIKLTADEFDEVDLNAKFERTAKEAFKSNFHYDYDGNRYIKGQVNLAENDDELDITAQNELGLRIVIDIEEDGDSVTVGEITDRDYEHYAYIRINEGLQVDFKDGDKRTLFTNVEFPELPEE